MRLRRLDLTRYGKFTDYGIDFGQAKDGTPDLHIVYGLNEAGKSTALAAYLDMLFGIERQSRYDFLHPYASMQIGGRLEFGGREYELIRVKQNTNSLLDAQRQPINEALLSVPLAGLTRDSYRTMFSLDDETLEEGGNAIIASKGDLGELLFSASAGLADLGTTLAAVQNDADRIYKRLGRSTDIAELKKQLVQLKAEREGVDTLASTHAGLVADLSQAQVAYEAAIGDVTALKTRQEAVTRILRAMPLAAEHNRLKQARAAFGTHPAPPAEWAADLPGLITRTTALDTEIAITEGDIARLDGEIAGWEIDERLLALAEPIKGLAEGMARFSTAQSDLPRRYAAMRDLEARIAAILLGLGQPGHQAPEGLLLAAPLVGKLRDLIEARSGLEAKLQAAQREVVAAKDGFERASAEKDAVQQGEITLDGAAVAGIDAALGALRRGTHQARLQLGERTVPQMARRYAAQIDTLLPWRGDGHDLRAVVLPGLRQCEAWRTRAGAIDKRRDEHAGKKRELMTRQREDQARFAAIRSAAGAIDDPTAQRLRQARDAAWASHVRTLNAASAEAFAAALNEDDALAAARLAHAQDLAELRALQQNLEITAASLIRQDELLTEADEEAAALAEEIRSATAAAIELPERGSIADWIEHIESWTKRQVDALAAWDALEQAEDDLRAARADLARDVAALAEAMVLAGFTHAEDLSATALAQAAETALTQGRKQQVTEAAADRALRDRQRDVSAREHDLAEARSAADEWQAAWTAALDETWFTDRGIGSVRETLDGLADLPAALGARDELRRRIDTMEQDQQDFAAGLAAILAQLGETLDPTAIIATGRQLSERHEAAEQARRTLAQKVKERARLSEILESLRQELSVFSARNTQMMAFFAVQTLEQVSAAMERSAERARLDQQIEGLERQIIGELRVKDIETALEQLATVEIGEAEREAAEIAARLNDLEERKQHLFTERSRAQDRLDAIGGDDAAARLDAQRRTVLLQIEDRAMTYLRLRTGAMVAEKALRAYREKHRSSMMNRASDAFALITRGDYKGLAARPEKDRETLIGLPRQGGSKLASDMSKGTQFQLYLALRLAGYQEFALTRPPVPFIADDIMETFDEPRSEEVFRLLGEMARIGQVIYLTHHRHLCDIAKAVVPGVRVHDIKG